MRNSKKVAAISWTLFALGCLALGPLQARSEENPKLRIKPVPEANEGVTENTDPNLEPAKGLDTSRVQAGDNFENSPPRIIETFPNNGQTVARKNFNGAWIKFDRVMDSRSVRDAIKIMLVRDNASSLAEPLDRSDYKFIPLDGLEKTDKFFIKIKFSSDDGYWLKKKFRVVITGEMDMAQAADKSSSAYKEGYYNFEFETICVILSPQLIGLSPVEFSKWLRVEGAMLDWHKSFYKDSHPDCVVDSTFHPNSCYCPPPYGPDAPQDSNGVKMKASYVFDFVIDNVETH
ncbi:MAG: hypothetical protein U1F66_00815 [bacterium]